MYRNAHLSVGDTEVTIGFATCCLQRIATEISRWLSSMQAEVPYKSASSHERICLNVPLRHLVLPNNADTSGKAQVGAFALAKG